MNGRSFFGLPVHISSYEDVLSYNRSDCIAISTLNAQYIARYHESAELRKFVDSSINTIDGRVPLLVGKIIGKVPFSWKQVTGSTLIFLLSEACARSNEKIFLLGASQDLNVAAQSKLRERFGVEVAGYSPDFIDMENIESESRKVLELIKKFQPSVVFVGLGVPKQDQWIYEYRQVLKSIGVGLIIGCGGAIDMAAEKYKIAPSWVRFLCLESVYRLLQQPSLFRFKRILESFRFLKYVGR